MIKLSKGFLILAFVLILLPVAGLLVASCTDAERARWSSYGGEHIVELYSGGAVVASFTSTGKVQCSDGGICDFMDKATGKLVRTTGDIVVRVK